MGGGGDAEGLVLYLSAPLTHAFKVTSRVNLANLKHLLTHFFAIHSADRTIPLPSFRPRGQNRLADRPRASSGPANKE